MKKHGCNMYSWSHSFVYGGMIGDFCVLFFIIFYIFKNKYVMCSLKNNKAVSIGRGGGAGGFGENLSVFKMQRLLGEGDGEHLGRVACEGRVGRSLKGT